MCLSLGARCRSTFAVKSSSCPRTCPPRLPPAQPGSQSAPPAQVCISAAHPGTATSRTRQPLKARIRPSCPSLLSGTPQSSGCLNGQSGGVMGWVASTLFPFFSYYSLCSEGHYICALHVRSTTAPKPGFTRPAQPRARQGAPAGWPCTCPALCPRPGPAGWRHCAGSCGRRGPPRRPC